MKFSDMLAAGGSGVSKECCSGENEVGIGICFGIGISIGFTQFFLVSQIRFR